MAHISWKMCFLQGCTATVGVFVRRSDDVKSVYYY